MIWNLLASCLFLSVLGSAQTHASTKVFLEDAETSKPIVGASVRLEGVGKADIVAAFDEKGRYYYFSDVPEGYTTVMAYHASYNEKGFQGTTGLPQEVKLKLYDPLNVSYGFEHERDSTFVYRKNKYFVTRHFRHLYVEDPYKVAVKVPEGKDCLQITGDMAAICPELEPINPYYKDNRDIDTQYASFSCGQIRDGKYNFPVAAGYGRKSMKGYEYEFSEPVVFFRRRDGSRFKRFNDPILARLAKRDVKIFGVVCNKAVYIGKARYRKSFTSRLDAENVKSVEDASKEILYTGRTLPLYGDNKYFDQYGFYGNPNGEAFSIRRDPDFYLIAYNGCLHFNDEKGRPVQASLNTTGLGILDQLEFFCKENKVQTADGLYSLGQPCINN